MDYSKIEGAIYVHFSKGEYIIKSGEKANNFYLVVSGQCYRLKTTYKGNQAIMATYKKNNIACAFTAYYDMVIASDIVARTTCYCWKIPRNSFIKAMENDLTLIKLFLEQILQEYYDLGVRFRSKQDGSTPNMLCSFLASHAQEKESGKFLVGKEYTNVAIAGYLGIHKVTAGRIINCLQKENIVERTKEGLLVKDMERLNEYAVQNKKLTY